MRRLHVIFLLLNIAHIIRQAAPSYLTLKLSHEQYLTGPRKYATYVRPLQMHHVLTHIDRPYANLPQHFFVWSNEVLIILILICSALKAFKPKISSEDDL